ncbi:adenylate/guanylate cyclase domain-containing protein [Bradyrhizobium sp. CCGUVB23]|uniref:adenylate/guanylate cyclase domain-containing protein n=1 Tax=Bradyrhizobium sp. CCGUVB23 TaxID=2949630 RepID=UPI0020B40EE7|nr:adenylate/guanylate cyclase domain-containing protein [Bradyrhizobium sp. CCGUVB23]MCP3465575.1 adenylate/guanylate cyclase domain-containing protein [Bradyrhizobium sp. CCGUVB23]
MVQEPPIRVERRLAAILAADVAGYSRLMHHDEEATHAKLTTLLADGVIPAISAHGGRIVKNTGDGFLAEFPSAVEAVRAAVQFQSRIGELTTADAEDRRIAFRVGINVGDVIIEPHDVFGDDVNIAARLESIAEPGGICISSSAYDHIRGKISAEFVDLGEQNLKNITRPIRAYAAVLDGRSPTTQVDGIRPGPLPPPRLSIVVLPFANVSGDPEQDYFVDGVTESLTTDLSRIARSFVIGRHTAFTYKGKSVDLKQIGHELNVRYALEGSVQRGDSRLRVNVQLVDTETGTHLWADRFDKPIGDLFDMQDEIVSRLANTLKGELIAVEARRSQRSIHPDAMDLNFQGQAYIYKGITAKNMSTARHFFKRALAVDTRSVSALVGMAMVDLLTAAGLLSEDRIARFLAAEEMANDALSIYPNHATAHWVLGGVYIYTDRVTQGVSECEEALRLDHNAACAHGFIGLAKYYMGRAAETEGHMLEALRLSPRDKTVYLWTSSVAIAKLQLGLDAEAAVWLRRTVEANRNFAFGHFLLAATLSLLGALDEARAAVRAGLALDPDFTIRRITATRLSDNPTYLTGRERICEGMRLAGIPEG